MSVAQQMHGLSLVHTGDFSATSRQCGRGFINGSLFVVVYGDITRGLGKFGDICGM